MKYFLAVIIFVSLAALLFVFKDNIYPVTRSGEPSPTPQMEFRDMVRRADLASLKVTLRLFYQKNNSFPKTATGNKLSCDPFGEGATLSSGSVEWGQAWDCDGYVYSKQLPKDPLQDRNYSYTLRTMLQQTAILRAKLENPTLDDLETINKCDGLKNNQDDNYVVCIYSDEAAIKK